MESNIQLFTNITIRPNDKMGLKRYFESLIRHLPENWKKLSDEAYLDTDTFFIINSVACIQSPYYKDTTSDLVFSCKLFLGQTDDTIEIFNINLDSSQDSMQEMQHLEMIAFIIHSFHHEVLKSNHHYEKFNHVFEFRGPKDENWKCQDIRDTRTLRILDKSSGKIYTLSKTDFTDYYGKKLYYPSSNSISLSLSIAKKSYGKAKKQYETLFKFGGNSDNTAKIDGDKKSILYDYFEEMITSIIFSYTAVETMANAAIPLDFTFEKYNEKNIKEVWNKENIERWMSTSEKIHIVLPIVLKTTDIKKEKFWNTFKELEKLRNKLIHQRTIEGGTQLDSGIYKELINKATFDKIKSSHRVIQFFYNYDNAHPYFPLGFGMAKFNVVPIENMEEHFALIAE